MSVLLVLSSLCLAAATVFLWAKNTWFLTLSRSDEQLLMCLALLIISPVMSLGFLEHVPQLLPITAGLLAMAVFFIMNRWFWRLYPAGLLFYVGSIGMLVTVPLWMSIFLWQIDVSTITRILLTISILPISFLFPFSILQTIEQFDVLCRHIWIRPREIKPLELTDTEPFVSIHIPTYSEPPELVIETIRSVLNLEYSRYEILVIDNNTKDESLWRPVESFCRTQGSRVRFFHFDELAGAKAGALNFAETVTDVRAKIISVMDADYHPVPTFLKDLVKHFEDERIGFVQTPHDYRDWERNTFLEMCYFEYKAFFYTVMIGLNEKYSGLTVGTMCLIRRSALVEAGGWSTWCVTEDSELAIRIHDKGYESIYVPISYGYGLIPERFLDFAKQRYRWVAGPVQELKHHFWRFVWPRHEGRNLSPSQRLHHFNHGLGSVLFGVQIPLLFLTLLAVISMVAHGEVVAVPFAVWLAATIQILSSFLLQYVIYTQVVRTTFRQMLLAIVTNKALLWTMQIASLKTLLDQNQRWQRTSKFKQAQTIAGALHTSTQEIIIVSGLVSFSIIMFILMPYPGFFTMILLGLLFRGFEYSMTPVVAMVSVRSQEQVEIDRESKIISTHSAPEFQVS